MFLLLLILEPLSVAYASDCASPNTQTEMNACADAAYRKTDAELNHLYQQVKGQLKHNQDTANLLVTAQKRWVGFRDAECAFRSSAGAGGSIYPLLVTQCRDKLTSERIEGLHTYLHCREGDMSCPVPIK
ncbi:MAG: lysozyme inhibitor LprI family protein [Rhodanobacter sp.]